MVYGNGPYPLTPGGAKSALLHVRATLIIPLALFFPPDCFFRPSPWRFFFFVARRGLHFGQFRRSLVHQVFCREKVEMILPISLTDGGLYLYSRLARGERPSLQERRSLVH